MDKEIMDQPGSGEQGWLEGLVQVIQGCVPEPENVLTQKSSKNKVANEENEVEATISSSITILTSDSDNRKRIIEYILATNGVFTVLETLNATAKLKVGEKFAKVLRELVGQKCGKLRVQMIKQCIENNYVAVTVSVLKQLVKNASNSPHPAPGVASLSKSTGSLLTSVATLDASSGISENSTATGLSSRSFTSLSSCYNDLGNQMTTTVDFLWFLAGVIVKDSQFADKVRQMLKVKFFHDVYKKIYYVKSSTHFPLLKIMKQLAKNKRVAEILGRDKVMTTAKKSIAVLNSQPNQKLIIFMECLAFLTKDRKNCIRFLKAGLLLKVLNVFRHWVHWKGKGLLKLSRAVINIYAHIARTKSGKRALAQTDSIAVIRSFCEQCPSERSFDDIIMRACAMIHIYYGKENLPLENLECPIKFQIPQPPSPDAYSDFPEFLLGDSGSSSDEDEDPEEGDEGDEDSDSDADNQSVGDDDGSDSDIEDDEAADLGCGDTGGSRKSSLIDKDNIREVYFEGNERSKIDKTARFSYYFREFSTHYEKDKEMEGNGVSIIDKVGDALGSISVVDEESDWNGRKTGDFKNASIPSVKYPVSEHKYSWTSRHGAKLPQMETLRKLYFQTANKTKHVSPFVKIAYPDVCFGISSKQVESFSENVDRVTLRKKVQNCINRAMNEHIVFKNRVVYNLDELINPAIESSANDIIGNSDETDLGKFDPRLPLAFESRFESGNMRKVIQVGDYEYDLLLTSDINSSRHNQWFYFQVSNIGDDQPYVFNIINCIKPNSLFNYGMQPVIYSVAEAVRNNRPGWVRCGSNVVYHRNGYKCIGKRSVKTYHTLSFSIQFPNRGDIVYIAYYIPYTYTRLMVETHNLREMVKQSKTVHCRYDVLCKSLDGNDIPVLTITGPFGNDEQTRITDRNVIFITSRVHPGETNASWIVMGIMRKLLLGNNMEELLQRYVFKVVPMLNVEGVVNGCHRSGLTSQDLNRCWMAPNEFLQPSIYSTKMLVAYCCKVRGKPPTAFIDLHGHSRRKNAFFYGCSFARSWRQEDRVTPENPQQLYALADSMSVHCPYFVRHFCHWSVRKPRETTARVAIWREFGITCSFTLECSYCGCDRGPSKGITFGTGQLWEIGEGLCEALSTMNCRNTESQDKLNKIDDVSVAIIES